MTKVFRLGIKDIVMNEQLPDSLAYAAGAREAEAAFELHTDAEWADFCRGGNPARKFFNECVTPKDWRAFDLLLKEATALPLDVDK